MIAQISADTDTSPSAGKYTYSDNVLLFKSFINSSFE